MVRIAVAAVCLYAILAISLALFQRSFLYPIPRPTADVPAGFELVSYDTDDGLTLSAGYRAAEDGMPTIVYFHGNGADWQSSVVATDRLVPQGYGVLAAEYRGYGGNPGSPSEEGLLYDGRAALRWLTEQGVAGRDLAIIGNSIGSGVATQLAVDANPFALVLISPFNSLQQLVGEKLWWLPTSLLLSDTFRSDRALPQVTAPTLILHGTADSLIPAKHAEQLGQTNDLATVELFEGYGHDLAWRDPAEKRTLEFLESLRKIER